MGGGGMTGVSKKALNFWSEEEEKERSNELVQDDIGGYADVS